jgi:tetratricopeptide (TPR) repeat protein
MFMLLMTVATLAPARPAAAWNDAEIADAVAKLGDPDPDVRERATAGLWSAGLVAQPALREAAAGDDPEAGRRARMLLIRFQLGLYPDTPQQVLDLVGQYFDGSAEMRQEAANELAKQGNRGLRALLGLRPFERREPARQAIVHLVGASPHARAGAALMVAEGDIPAAADVLKIAADEGAASAVRDWAALLLHRGGIDERITRLRDEARTSPDGEVAGRLTYLARARGDLSLAIQAADESDSPELVDSILVEAGDWKRLAMRYRAHLGRSSDTLGFTAAFCRLAGDTEGFEAATAALRDMAARHREEYFNCAQCLMLNDRVDEGVALLMANRNYVAATDFLLPRLRLREALELPERCKDELGKVDLLQLRARVIAARIFAGDRAGAERALREVAADNAEQKDLTTWLLLSDAARQLNQGERADGFLAAAMELPDSGDGEAVLAHAALPRSFSAMLWWKILRVEHMSESYAKTVKRLRSMAKGEMPAEQVEALASEAEKTAAEMRPFDRDCRLELVGQTLELLGRRESAERIYRRLLAFSPSFISFQLVGNCEAARGDFAQAAITFQQAWEMDRTRPIPLALQGWALLKSGDAKKGREAIELAHLLPLADETQRTRLEEVFRERGLPEDARRERELILKTGELRPNQNASGATSTGNTFLSWDVCNAYRLRGDEEYARRDFLAAANSWERAFLGNLQANTSSNDPWGNVAIRALIHKTRAMGFIKPSPQAALREAAMAIAEVPDDTAQVVELVQAFEQASRRPDADALFAQAAATYAKMCEAFPASELAHNLLAWTEARCGRNLDNALKHALRAVEIAPTSTATLDTLAEVYFARGDIDNAVAKMRKCVELEPGVARHRQQLERFLAARAVKKTEHR